MWREFSHLTFLFLSLSFSARSAAASSFSSSFGSGSSVTAAPSPIFLRFDAAAALADDIISLAACSADEATDTNWANEGSEGPETPASAIKLGMADNLVKETGSEPRGAAPGGNDPTP